MRSLTASNGTKIYLLAIVANLAVQFVGAIVLVAVGTASDAADTLNIIFSFLIQVAFAVILTAILVRGDRSLGYTIARPKPYTPFIALGLSAVCIAGFMIPSDAVSIFLRNVGFSSPSVELKTAADYTLFIVNAAVAAPLMEELVFRGALTGGLTKKFGAAGSVLLSGLAFSLMHMNPDQTVYQFLLGCSCAYIAICTRSVLAPILMHAGSNAIALVIQFAPVPAVPYSSHPAAVAAAGIALFVAAVAIIALVGAFLAGRERTRDGGKLFAFGPVSESVPTAAEKPEKGLRALFSPVHAAIKVRHAEDAADEADVASGRRRGSALGRGAHVAYLSIGLVVCLLMWIMTLVSGLGFSV